MKRWIRLKGRERRRKIIRKKIHGSTDTPRLNVYRSLKHIHAQLIDDSKGETVLSLSTNSPDLKERVKNDGGNIKGAGLVGEALADLCKKKGIKKVVFDRAGYHYHGRVKALAEAARKGGLEF
ncbi:MAG: 50S ribosomal protein L18 [Candidatus Omnitrophica bacterium]|nr:50S ribosomal protein L18 [Candidatus Omnitrophota bacterium]